MTALVFLAGFGLFLGALSAHIESRTILHELAAHFQLQYFIGAALILPLSFAFSPPAVLPAIVALALSGSEIFRLRRPQDTPRGQGYRLLQANVLKLNKNYTPLLNMIRAGSPDLVVAVEVTPGWHAALESLSDLYPHRLSEPRTSSFGVAILSKTPFEETEIIAVAGQDIPTLAVKTNGIRLIGFHPPTPMSLAGWQKRDILLDTLATWIRVKKDKNVIVAGDFNITPYAPAYKDFIKKTGLTNARHGIYGSWPVAHPAFLRLPIDHVLVSNAVQVTGFKLGRDIKSDHLPTLTTFRVL